MAVRFRSGQMYDIADLIVRLREDLQDDVAFAFAKLFTRDNPKFELERWQKTLINAREDFNESLRMPVTTQAKATAHVSRKPDDDKAGLASWRRDNEPLPRVFTKRDYEKD